MAGAKKLLILGIFRMLEIVISELKLILILHETGTKS